MEGGMWLFIQYPVFLNEKMPKEAFSGFLVASTNGLGHEKGCLT